MGQRPAALKRMRGGLPILAALVMLVVPAPAARADNNPLEYAVKATYLYKFGPFIEWPRAAFESPDSAVNLCVVGYDPFGSILDEAIRGQHIGKRSIIARRLRTVDRHSGCHIMYVGGSESQSVAEVLDIVRGTPVLTVTDAERTPTVKGIIHFVIYQDRVRFEIDDYAAAENGLMISSKVLNLALSVRPRA